MLVEPVTTAVPNVTETAPDIVAVTLPPIVTAEARSCASVRPPVIVTWPTAVAISVIACVPKDTTVWAGI
jgi:hypothetical protein